MYYVQKKERIAGSHSLEWTVVNARSGLAHVCLILGLQSGKARLPELIGYRFSLLFVASIQTNANKSSYSQRRITRFYHY